MNDKEFAAIVRNRGLKSTATLASKAREYARGDRLSNFKKAAAAMGTVPEKACVAFWMKHVISICDMVNDIERTQGLVVWNSAMWDEKIGDAVNYLILLEALVKERLDTSIRRRLE